MGIDNGRNMGYTHVMKQTFRMKLIKGKRGGETLPEYANRLGITYGCLAHHWYDECDRIPSKRTRIRVARALDTRKEGNAMRPPGKSGTSIRPGLRPRPPATIERTPCPTSLN